MLLEYGPLGDNEKRIDKVSFVLQRCLVLLYFVSTVNTKAFSESLFASFDCPL